MIVGRSTPQQETFSRPLDQIKTLFQAILFGFPSKQFFGMARFVALSVFPIIFRASIAFALGLDTIMKFCTAPSTTRSLVHTKRPRIGRGGRSSDQLSLFILRNPTFPTCFSQ